MYFFFFLDGRFARTDGYIIWNISVNTVHTAEAFVHWGHHSRWGFAGVDWGCCSSVARDWARFLGNAPRGMPRRYPGYTLMMYPVSLWSFLHGTIIRGHGKLQFCVEYSLTILTSLMLEVTSSTISSRMIWSYGRYCSLFGTHWSGAMIIVVVSTISYWWDIW